MHYMRWEIRWEEIKIMCGFLETSFELLARTPKGWCPVSLKIWIINHQCSFIEAYYVSFSHINLKVPHLPEYSSTVSNDLMSSMSWILLFMIHYDKIITLLFILWQRLKLLILLHCCLGLPELLIVVKS